jgi:predicted house-cleaning NTP pyrophosphatase (Maf/HAM1 superfamily)
MRPYSDAEVAAYVASGDPLDKAGAYAIQNASFHPVAEYRGCYANVVGLPLCHLARSLRTWEIEPLAGLPVRCQAHTGQTCSVFQAILGREK